MSELRDDLENLLASPGWHWLEAKVKTHWSDQLAAHVRQAASEQDDLIAIAKLRQVVAAHTAVEQVLNWPRETLTSIKGETHKQAPHPFSRGGL